MSKSKDQKVELKNQDEIKNNPENETKDENVSAENQTTENPDENLDPSTTQNVDNPENPENETKDEGINDTTDADLESDPLVSRGPAEKPEEDKTQKILDNVVKNEEETEKKAKAKDEIGTINGTPVYQKSAFIKTEQYKTPVPMYRIPEDIRQYLKNMGFGTNVYLMPKEWLIEHKADMKMIKKLKDFISENFN